MALKNLVLESPRLLAPGDKAVVHAELELENDLDKPRCVVALRWELVTVEVPE